MAQAPRHGSSSTFKTRLGEGASKARPAADPGLGGVYFFLSLDLVNSTKLKTTKTRTWPSTIGRFYVEAASVVVECFQRFRSPWTTDGVFDGVWPKLWKYVGDEVLFYLRLASEKQATSCVAAAYEAIEVTRKRMEEAGDREVSVKGTCWSAVVDYVPRDRLCDENAERTAPNIVFATDVEGTGSSVDFLGPDIDAGFRTTVAAMRGVLVVGADLSWFMTKIGAPMDVLGNLRTVELRELKGVWSGQHYPIVYYANWALIETIYQNEDPFRHPRLLMALETSTQTTEKLLARAIEANNRDPLFNQMCSRLGSSTREQGHQADNCGASASLDSHPARAVAEGLVPLLGPALHGTSDGVLACSMDEDHVLLVDPEPRVSLHWAAICFNSRGQAMLAKRHPRKRILPDTWEYGCAQLRPGDTLKSAVIRDYQLDFGIKVDFSKWEDPVPIATYAIGTAPNQVSGVIVVAECDGPEHIKVTENKHTEARWFDPTKLPDKAGENVVPHMDSQVEQAVNVWKSVQAH